MTEEELRAAVVAEAISWELTPYHPYGRVKGAGVDCAMLPACVYEAVGLAPEVNPRYTSDWMMHRDEELYLSYILPHAREITKDRAGPGDLIIWKYGRTYSHSAIVLDYPEVIHAVVRARMVCRADVERDVDLKDRPCKYFTVIGQ